MVIHIPNMYSVVGVVKLLCHWSSWFKVVLVVDPVMVSTSGDTLVDPSILIAFQHWTYAPSFITFNLLIGLNIFGLQTVETIYNNTISLFLDLSRFGSWISCKSDEESLNPAGRQALVNSTRSGKPSITKGSDSALVIDLVMVSTSGDILADPSIIIAFRPVLQEELLPMADFVALTRL
ncbi:hypothetical protein IFM89_035114 [Coptis chinensis]|uniref:Uncharacterized protein n=1 Tax=Coptis chinensis TaxID=261450 RepID=A0A835IIU0_9MAGN|nr:hypothetical protein IFM89_035114 [Coptis chinensis]